MAITVYTSTATVAEQSAATSVTVNVPSGVVNGDLLVLSLAAGSTMPSTFTGWTQTAPAASSGSVTVGQFYRVASSEPASYTFSGFGSSRITAEMVRLTGASSTTPLDAAASAGGGANMTAPTVTTAAANAVIVYAVGEDAASVSDLTDPTGVTRISDSTGTGKRLVTAYEAQPTAGTSAARTWTETGSTGLNMAAVTAAFDPSAGSAYSGSAALAGSSSLTGAGAPRPTQSSSLTGAGSLTTTATIAANSSAGLSGSSTLSGAPVGSGTGSAALSGAGVLIASGSASSTAAGATAGAGVLAATGAGSRYVFQGPVFYEYLPLQVLFPPSRLRAAFAYGETVWRDSTGAWQQQFAPSLDQLAGASVVYGGGRMWPLTDQERADLTAAGYGAYITLELIT